MRYRFRRKRRRMDKSITFQGPPAATNEFNEQTGEWEALFTTRCALYPAPGSEKYANRNNAAEAPVLIEVRREERTLALTPSNRAIVDGKTYEIVSLEQPERGSNLVIAAVFNGG